jgi:4-amino-4-deoxy-L-arabinose transferase-like glycosyltransferase
MKAKHETDISHRFHKTALVLVTLAFVAVTGWYSVKIPPGEGVDEAHHFAYVRYVKEQKALPVQPMEGKAVQVWMGHHPPLYYLLGSLAISWIDTSDFDQVLRPNPHFVWAENDGRNGWNVMLHFGQDVFPWQGTILALHVMRWISVTLGAVAVIAVYNATRYLLPKYRWSPAGAASLMAFNPSFVYMSSTVHHDVLLATIFSLGLWWAVRVVSVPLRGRDLWIGGLLAGAAALTKLSGMSLVAVMGLALLLKAWSSRHWQRAMKRIAHLLCVAMILSGWWYVRNQVLYGDPLGWQMFLSLYHFNVRQTPYTWYLFWHEFIPQLGRTFWGAFGFMHITFPEISRYLWLATGIAVLGLGIMVVRRIRQLRLAPQLLAWVVVMGGLVMIFTLFVRYSFTFAGGGHARYLFPAAPAIGGLLIAGFNGFTNWRHERFVVLMLSLGLLGYAIWLPLTLVLPKYAAPEMASAEEIEWAAPSDWVFGDAVKLVAYGVEPDLAIPDAWLTLYLYWQAVGPATDRPDVRAHVRLVTDKGETLHATDFWPAKSSTPAVWAPGETVVSHPTLHIPAEGRTGQLHVEVTLTSGRDGPSLHVRRGTSEKEKALAARLGPIPAVGQVVEVTDDMVPNRRREIFGEVIALAGYELPEGPLQPGQTMVVKLFWHVLQTPPADYTVFVHVINDQGQLVTQFDRPPGGGTSPTTSWQPGQTLMDTYPVPIPVELPSGEYAVHVGMYTWPSLERQPVSIDGAPAGDTVRIR